jgi:hypothetical protein
LELNDAVELLAGEEEPLTERQLKKAFYDGMPSTWKDRFLSSGESFAKMTRNQMVRYFRDQETLANKRKRENEQSQKKAKRTTEDRNKKDKRRDTRVKDSDPCPKHPFGSHTWGECRSRQNKKEHQKDKQPDHKSVCRNDKNKAKSKEATNYLVDVAKEVEYLPKEGASICFTIETLDQFDDHLSSDFLSNNIHIDPLEETVMMEAYCMAMEDCVALGNSSDEIGSEKLISKRKLMPIGIMIIGTVQGQPLRQPLRVLFDSGSSRTLINPRILPSSVVAHDLVHSLTLQTGGGSIQANHGVKLHHIRFPESSPTRVYTIEVEAIVSPHTALYDVILGHDLMVAARMVICCEHKPSDGEIFVPWKDSAFLRDETFHQYLRKPYPLSNQKQDSIIIPSN